MNRHQYQTYRKNAYLISNADTRTYCKRYIKMVSGAISQAKDVLSQLKSQPRMIAVEPDEAFNINYIFLKHDENGNPNLKTFGFGDRFSLDFDVSGFLSEAIQAHKKMNDPKNYLKPAEIIGVFRSKVRKDDQKLRLIFSDHPRVKELHNYGLALSDDRKRINDFYKTKDWNEDDWKLDTEAWTDDLVNSKTPYCRTAGKTIRHKFACLASLHDIHKDVKADPSAIFDKSSINSDDDVYTWKDNINPCDYANYQLFVAYRDNPQALKSKDEQKYEKYLQDTNLMTHTQAISYCKHYLERAKKPYEQAVAVLKQVEADPKMIAVKPGNGDISRDHNYIYITGYDGETPTVGFRKRFSVDFDIVPYLKRAVQQHQVADDPDRFLTKRALVRVLKGGLKADDRQLQSIGKAHPNVTNIDFDVAQSSIEDIVDYINFDGMTLSAWLKSLCDNRAKFRRRTGNLITDRIKLLRMLNSAQKVSRAKPKPLFSKEYADHGRIRLRDDCVDKGDYADYQLFVKHLEH